MIFARVQHDPDVRQTLARLRSAGAQNRILRRAITAALKDVKRDLKAAAKRHRLTGATDKSIGTKVATSRKSRSGKGGRTTGIVGPRADFTFRAKDGTSKKPLKYFGLANRKNRFASDVFQSHARSWLATATAHVERLVEAELAKGAKR